MISSSSSAFLDHFHVFQLIQGATRRIDCEHTPSFSVNRVPRGYPLELISMSSILDRSLSELHAYSVSSRCGLLGIARIDPYFHHSEAFLLLSSVFISLRLTCITFQIKDLMHTCKFSIYSLILAILHDSNILVLTSPVYTPHLRSIRTRSPGTSISSK